jgi:hypothetical protein
MRITSEGNVGIGTAAPTSRLHVVGDARITTVLSVGGNALVAGNVGIGTTNPVTKLHVVGDIRANNACRAWATFSNTGTTASYNISSFTRNAVGTYTLTFTSALPSANYAVAVGPAIANIGANYPVYVNKFTRSTGNIQVVIGSAHATGAPDVNYDITSGAASIVIYSL